MRFNFEKKAEAARRNTTDAVVVIVLCDIITRCYAGVSSTIAQRMKQNEF